VNARKSRERRKQQQAAAQDPVQVQVSRLEAERDAVLRRLVQVYHRRRDEHHQAHLAAMSEVRKDYAAKVDLVRDAARRGVTVALDDLEAEARAAQAASRVVLPAGVQR
jgi:uncharacterized protein YlxW (UPF0749 family)